MIRVVAWVLAVTLAVACSYTQMQPKQGDRPPAPAAPRVP
jgi:hypothetical protein